MKAYVVNHVTNAGETRDSLHKELSEARLQSDYLAENYDCSDTGSTYYYISVDEYDVNEEGLEVLVENLDVLRYLDI